MTHWLGCQRIDLESCASTNDEAARYARAGASHGTLVIAERQEAGRGREGRSWASPSGGLYLSAVMRPPLPLADVPPITLAIGIAVCDAARAFGAAAALKWPNDVLVGTKKLAGILVETQSQGGRLDSVIVGVGVNLAIVPEAVAGRAIALGVDREPFIAVLLEQLERWVDHYVACGLDSIIPSWQQRMAPGLSARAMIDGAALCGELAGIDLDGALLLRDDTGKVHRVRSGDVEVIRPDAVLSPTA
ncbi:MAG TPA: biotin--[acetyl-CoA-carboxylase] ligase [Kofleriaceae bacterium]|nr:biotin--[acetyl-CoA-carboxylase] ligase [Kofleriaceae bacterium]